MNTEIGQPPQLIRAPRGNTLTFRGWEQEAALRMLIRHADAGYDRAIDVATELVVRIPIVRPQEPVA